MIQQYNTLGHGRSVHRIRYFLPRLCALFARSPRMIRLFLICVLALAGCARENRDDDAEAAEEVPIGPGSDSSALIPPDTPMTRRTPAPVPPGLQDTTSPPVTTR